MKKTIQQFVFAAALLLVSCQMQAQFVIGKDTLGGKVAYIDASGQHGLIAARTDQSLRIIWGNDLDTRAAGTAIGTGSENTANIIYYQGNPTGSNYAANLCRNYNGTGYTDWYLPSKDELNKLYINRVAIGSFGGNYYWSSTAYSYSFSWGQYFYNNNGLQYCHSNTSPYSVRAVRTF